MLEVADLESDLLTKEHSLLQHGRIGPFDKTKELESAELCVQKTRLSVLISQILELRAEAKSQQDEVAPAPTNDAKHLRRLHAVDASVRSWKKALPRSCSYRPLTSRNGEAGRTPVDVRRHLLHMVYYTALYTLHRPQSLPDVSRQLRFRNANQTEQISSGVVQDSTKNITRLAAELNQHNMDSNLPVAAITILLSAISMHLLNIKSQNKSVRDMAIDDLRVCMKILNKMQKLYSAAEATVGFLETILSKTTLTGVVGRNLEPNRLADQPVEADPMDIIQSLAAPTFQAMLRELSMLSSSWDHAEPEINTSSQSEILDPFGPISLNVDEFPAGGSPGVPVPNIPYGIDLDFDAAQVDAWMTERNQDWELDGTSIDMFTAISSGWTNSAMSFSPL